ncbi:hypothetical protein [Streptomyces sp. NPDC056883]|uniref:hypothetical protein n=1 Tax=Streptomyces sp. NPDC056883 TaxID=3345959 RepID=UPI0036C1F3D5
MTVTTSMRAPSAEAESVDVRLIPMALPVRTEEERACSCIYCFKSKATVTAPPMRYAADGAGSGR